MINEELNEKPVDTAYGGCKYRLSYDAAEIRRELKQKKQELKRQKKNASLATKTGTTVAVISVIAVFIVFGVCILAYYNNAVKKIFGENESKGSSDSSYANVNVVND